MFRASIWLAALCVLWLLMSAGEHGALWKSRDAYAADLEVAGAIPPPPGAKEVERDGEKGVGLTATIPKGDKAAVLKFYADYFDEQGWTLFKSFGLGFADTRFYRKGEKTVTVHVTKMFGEVDVLINDLTDSDRAISTEALAAATAKLPLPPGATASRLASALPAGSFSLSADLPKATEEEVQSFYRDYFATNGWNNNVPPDQPAVDWLDYDKGRQSASVRVDAIDGGIALRVNYREYEYTRSEFDKRADESATPEATALIQRMTEAYGALKSYADTGTHESIHDGEVLSTAKFSTHYRAPDNLRFEYVDSLNGWFNTTYVLSKQGDSVRVESSIGGFPDIGNDLSLAIAGLYGVTSATSGNIPEFLLRVGNGKLVHLVDLTIQSEAKADDGTLCLRLHGKDFGSHQRTIWIGKDDLLIRKIEAVENAENRQTTTYSPRANVEIAEEDLALK